jgi:hypothetical protein
VCGGGGVGVGVDFFCFMMLERGAVFTFPCNPDRKQKCGCDPFTGLGDKRRVSLVEWTDEKIEREKDPNAFGIVGQ